MKSLAPIAAVIALVILLIGGYVGAYLGIGKRQDSCNSMTLETTRIERIYRDEISVTLFAPAAWIESALRAVPITVRTFDRTRIYHFGFSDPLEPFEKIGSFGPAQAPE